MYVESVDEQVESLLAFEIALDKHWEDQEILYDNYRAPIVNKKFGAKLPVWCVGFIPTSTNLCYVLHSQLIYLQDVLGLPPHP